MKSRSGRIDLSSQFSAGNINWVSILAHCLIAWLLPVIQLGCNQYVDQGNRKISIGQLSHVGEASRVSLLAWARGCRSRLLCSLSVCYRWPACSLSLRLCDAGSVVRGSDVKPEVDYISILHDVIFAFEAQFARLSAFRLAAAIDQIFVSDNLGADKAAFNI